MLAPFQNYIYTSKTLYLIVKLTDYILTSKLATYSLVLIKQTNDIVYMTCDFFLIKFG